LIPKAEDAHIQSKGMHVFVENNRIEGVGTQSQGGHGQ
jgi:hypothetical protein